MSRLPASVPLAFLLHPPTLQPSLTSLNAPQSFLFPSNMFSIPSIIQSVFKLLFLIFQAPSPVTEVMWCFGPHLDHGGLNHPFVWLCCGCPQQLFQCSLNGCMKMLLLPSNCPLRLQGWYSHIPGKRPFRFTQIIQRILEIKFHRMIRELSKPDEF